MIQDREPLIEELKLVNRSAAFERSPELIKQESANGGYLEDEDDAFKLQNHNSSLLVNGQEGPLKRTLITYENERIWLGIWTTKLFPGGKV